MQTDEDVEAVLQQHQHVEAAQEFAQHDALVDTLAPAQRIARVGHLLPILERGTAVVAPEFGAAIERRKIGERLGEAAVPPIGSAPRQVLADVEPERHRQLLFLDHGDVEIGGRRDTPFGQFNAIIDWRHCAATEDPAGSELGRPHGCSEFLKERLAVGAQPEKQVGHEDRHQPRKALSKIRAHPLEVAVGLPQRIAGFDEGRTEFLAQDRLDLGRRRNRDRSGGPVAGPD